MTAPALIDLYHHMAWADATEWGAGPGCEAARTDTRLRETLSQHDLF